MLSEDKSKIISRTNPNPLTNPQPIRPGRSPTPDQAGSEQRPASTASSVESNDPAHTPVTEHPSPKAQIKDEPRGTSVLPTDIHRGQDMPTVTPQVDPSTTNKEPNQISQDAITRQMSITEVLECLSRHGCKSATEALDLSKLSEYPISSGGYGDVYRGAMRDGQLVAVKCLRMQLDSTEIAEKQLKRAARELYVWSKCDHPNVLGLIGVGQYRNQIAMVSPWMEHGNVRRFLAFKPKTDRYILCLQVADGVAYMHDMELTHGDLKGDNILLSDDMVPKVTDFGNAALREYTLQFSKTTGRAGMSLNWVAPEVFEEETGLTAEADVYSLGMTMFEIITGSPPYTGLREPAIMKKIMGGVHPTRPEEHIPTGKKHADLLWSLLKSCWAFTSKDRPTSAEVRDKMQEVISEREKEAGSEWEMVE